MIRLCGQRSPIRVEGKSQGGVLEGLQGPDTTTDRDEGRRYAQGLKHS